MKERTLTVRQIGMIAGTRVALGVGIGLLVARKLTEQARNRAGWALLSIGALTTIPIVRNVLATSRPAGAS